MEKVSKKMEMKMKMKVGDERAPCMGEKWKGCLHKMDEGRLGLMRDTC